MEKEINIMGKIVCSYCGIDCELFRVVVITHHGANSNLTNETMCKDCIEKENTHEEWDSMYPL